jgi:hypothetical protein
MTRQITDGDRRMLEGELTRLEGVLLEAEKDAQVQQALASVQSLTAMVARRKVETTRLLLDEVRARLAPRLPSVGRLTRGRVPTPEAVREAEERRKTA